MTAIAAAPIPRRPACDLARLGELGRALSDSTRLEVLDLLRHGERCVCDLQSDIGIAQSRLSFHLRVLREAGLVECRKDGRWCYYLLSGEALDEANTLISALAPPARSLPVAPENCCG